MTSSRSRRSLVVVNLLGWIVVVVVNALATAIPLGGMTTGALSDLYPNLFVPAGITFAIWGLIYVLLGVFAVYGIVYTHREIEPVNGFPEKIGVLFALSCVANAGWIFAWQYRHVVLSLVSMLVLLAALIGTYLSLGIGRSRARRAERILVHVPMSVYLGWITVATIANVTAVIVRYHRGGFGGSEQAWAVAVISVGILVGLAAAFLRRDIAFALVIDWAVLGILLKRLAVGAGTAHGVVVVSIVGIVVLTLAAIVQVARGRARS